MLIEHLDRTQWWLSQAVEHVAAQIRNTQPAAVAPATAPEQRFPPWKRHEDPGMVARDQAAREIQIALRDGDLHAQGRLSTTPAMAWSRPAGGWDLHSGRHTSITPEQWRAGRADVARGALSMLEGEFIDIRVPRFVVLAIWPVIQPPPPADAAGGAPYRTPYLDLLDRAIVENRLSEIHQSKKEQLADWFRRQEVEGEPVSQNLADAMATLIRLPASQRGGAKRGW